MENDKLLAGMASYMPTKSVILSGAGIYKRGQILQLVSTDAKGVDTVKVFDGALAVAPVGGNPGTPASLPYGILADEEVDTASGPRPASAFTSGEFNMDAVRIDGTLKPMDYQGVLADAGIFLKRVRG